MRRVAHASARPIGLIAAFAPTLVSPPPPAGQAVSDAQLPIVDRDSYELIAEYGRGGMGRVLVARDNRLGRRVAIKELLATDPHAIERFVREVRITARLQHPSIVPVHAAGRWPSGEPFYAMKLVSGRPLSIVIDETHALDERLALVRVLIAVAEAVAYAHKQRVIHRDLKPDNILVGEFGETVVIDWGLAKQLDEAADLAPEPNADSGENRVVTIAGTVVGTPGFMSPEQAAGKDADERSDVYALGAILYTLLAGRPPYSGQDAKTVVARTLAGPPPALQERQRELPADLLTIVDKAMAREATARYPSAKELAADLNRFTTGQLVSAHRYSWPQRVLRFVRRNRLPVAVVTVATVLLFSFAVAGVEAVVRERDMARQERAVALQQKAAAEAARATEMESIDRLVLSQARAALDGDPTLAMAWLKRLRRDAGGWSEARVVAARAQAKSVAYDIRPGVVAALSSDGTVLATADNDGAVRLFAGGDDGEVLDGNVGRPAAIAFSRDAARLAVGGSGGARLYDVPARRVLPLEAMDDDVGALAISDAGLFAFAGSRGVRLCDREGRALPAPATTGAVTQLAFVRDELLLRDQAGVIAWRDNHARRLASAEPGPMAVSHEPARVAVGTSSGVRVVDLATGQLRKVSGIKTTRLALAPDGERIALCGADGTLSTLGLTDGTSIAYSHNGEHCRDLVYDDAGSFMAQTRGPQVRLWSLPGGAIHKLRGHEGEVMHLAVSRDGRWLASGGIDGKVRVWRVEPGPSPALPLGHEAAQSIAHDDALALSPDGTRLAAATRERDETLRLHGFNGDDLVATLTTAPRALAWNGGRLAVAAGDETLLFAAQPSAPPATMARESLRVALSADGNWLAAQRQNGTLELQGLPPSRAPEALVPPLSPAIALALAPDGTQVAAAAGGRVVHVWTRARHRQFDVDYDARALTFLDGEFLAVADISGGVELIHLPTGEHWPLPAPRARVVALSSDKTALHAISDDGRVRVWPPLPPSGPEALHEWLDTLTRARLDEAGRLR